MAQVQYSSSGFDTRANCQHLGDTSRIASNPMLHHLFVIPASAMPKLSAGQCELARSEFAMWDPPLVSEASEEAYRLLPILGPWNINSVGNPGDLWVAVPIPDFVHRIKPDSCIGVCDPNPWRFSPAYADILRVKFENIDLGVLTNFLVHRGGYDEGAQLLETLCKSHRKKLAIRCRIPLDEHYFAHEVAKIPLESGIESLSKIGHVIVISTNYYTRKTWPIRLLRVIKSAEIKRSLGSKVYPLMQHAQAIVNSPNSFYL
jgi:hypothetical protein